MAKSRSELLRLASDYVAELGVAGFTLRACAEAIGTSHRMLSYHFGSRQGLLRAISENVGDELQQRLLGHVDALPAGGSPTAESVADAVARIDPAAVAELLTSDRARRDARLIIESAYLRLTDPSYGGYQKAIDRWSRTANLITGARDPDGPPTPRARVLIAALMGLTLDISGGASTEDIRAAAEELVALIGTGAVQGADR